MVMSISKNINQTLLSRPWGRLTNQLDQAIRWLGVDYYCIAINKPRLEPNHYLAQSNPNQSRNQPKLLHFSLGQLQLDWATSIIFYCIAIPQPRLGCSLGQVSFIPYMVRWAKLQSRLASLDFYCMRPHVQICLQ